MHSDECRNENGPTVRAIHLIYVYFVQAKEKSKKKKTFSTRKNSRKINEIERLYCCPESDSPIQCHVY